MKIVTELYKLKWNIGFCECDPEEFIHNQGLSDIRWMKHPFKDRWFADPFIYKVTDQSIIVFVEEYRYSTRRGVLCELEINKTSMQLCQRRELLSLNTHLSYPIWIKQEGKTYLYPENGESGQLNIYEYNETKHSLSSSQGVILDEAVADSSIVKEGGTYYLVATKYPETEKDLYLYKSDTFNGPYIPVSLKPVQTNPSMSRPGGNWFRVGNLLYRPAQNCNGGYGRSLTIMQANIKDSSMIESECFKVKPKSFTYNLGLHTINFLDGMCVIDAHGYQFPILGRALDFIRKLRNLI